MAWTDIPIIGAGAALTAAKLNDIIGDLGVLGGEWAPYTPALSGPGWALGGAGGSITGAFREVGRTVDFRAQVTFGAGATFGATTFAVTLPPVTPLSGVWWLFRAMAYDVSALSRYYMHAYTNMGTNGAVASFNTAGAAGLATGTSSTSPFTWAAGDQVFVQGTYEAA